MPSLYTCARQLMATGGFNWPALAPGVMLVSAAYTPDFVNDTTLTNVPTGARLTSQVALTSPTVVSGYCGAEGVAFGALNLASPIQAIMILSGSGALIAYLDTFPGQGAQPVGQDFYIAWDTRGIFQP
jgi:hypothetical protein